MKKLNPLKQGPWKLDDLKNIAPIGLNVFSCFHCAGGSTMGYKLAGFNVLGGVEIDPEMMAIYRLNHHPQHSYLMGVQEFKNIPDTQLPSKLFELDILDGSPPCSSFSMSGAREKKWGKASKFREGQAVQHLDDLFFDFIDVAKKLRPKVVVAENVKGLLLGNAKGYVKQIFSKFSEAGYNTQLFLLNASRMGVPQKRERVFFIANRIGEKINLHFSEKIISIGQACIGASTNIYDDISKYAIGNEWKKLKSGEQSKKYFSLVKPDKNKPIPTITAKISCPSAASITHWLECRKLSSGELCRAQTFPDDFNFLNSHAGYICGMSVPPFMMQRVATEIARQFFNL